MNVLDLFSGIGGFSLGLERAGFKTVAFCEIDPFCQKVLKKHWPDVPIYEDVRDVSKERLESDGIGRVDVITGGFPCQDISVSAPTKKGYQRGEGLDGNRSGLWAECARSIRDFRPRYAIFENVPNLLNGERGDWFKRVLWDIYKVGYDAEWHCIPAATVGLPHRRDRVWIIAYPRREHGGKGVAINGGVLTETVSEKFERLGKARDWRKIGARICRDYHGIPDRSHRLKSLGNAVVPQIPEIIGRAIMEVENER